MSDENPSPPNFTGFFTLLATSAPLLIAVDALSTLGYMSLMTGLFASIPVIVIRGFAGALLNFVLYQMDLPDALHRLFDLCWHKTNKTMSFSYYAETIIAIG